MGFSHHAILRIGSSLALLAAGAFPLSALGATPADSPAPNPPDAVTTPAPDPPQDPPLLKEYRQRIAETERGGGAYAAPMPEQLLGLGTALQQFNRHEEAIEIFRRGAHLARVHTGLYSGEQIPLLRGEIRSHMALGDYLAVDERQRYLYRVERQALGNNTRASAEALLHQAQWQQRAYLWGVGDEELRSGRLLLMWDLLRMSLKETIALHGEDAPELRPPLIAMLKTQYLAAGHDDYAQVDNTSRTDLRLIALTSDAFERGDRVLTALEELNQATNAPPEHIIQDRVARGDWSWWFGKRDDALIHYRAAMALLGDCSDPTGTHAAIFARPAPLPTLEGIEALPRPTWGGSLAPDRWEPDALVVSFTVTDTGRVIDLERLQEPEVQSGRAMSRLLRTLRQTRFRPRFDEGVPVTTEGLVWSWHPGDWQMDTNLE